MIKKSDVEAQKYILLEVIMGICIAGVLVMILAMFTDNRIYNLIGLLYGMAVAMGLGIHMWMTTNRAFELIYEDISRYITKNYFLRMCLVALFMLIIIYFNFGSYLFALVGIFTLKVSAYLQPLTHKLLKCIAKGE